MQVGDIAMSLVTLSAMEIVLGMDNIIFLSILTGRLPESERPKARRLGLIGALGMRVALLFALSWLASLTTPLFTLMEKEISVKSLVLAGGGVFLLYKATHEIYVKLESVEHDETYQSKKGTFWSVVAQLMVLDLVFSIDSVITAVGMSQELWIMVAANVFAILAMMFVAGPIGAFVERHPSIKVLALSFLIMIGTMLVGEGIGFHIPKGYIYFAMAFSVGVEILNIRTASRKADHHLPPPRVNATPPTS
jgi:predicted tellurium resistance membrane protein TerC